MRHRDGRNCRPEATCDLFIAICNLHTASRPAATTARSREPGAMRPAGCKAVRHRPSPGTRTALVFYTVFLPFGRNGCSGADIGQRAYAFSAEFTWSPVKLTPRGAGARKASFAREQ